MQHIVAVQATTHGAIEDLPLYQRMAVALLSYSYVCQLARDVAGVVTRSYVSVTMTEEEYVSDASTRCIAQAQREGYAVFVSLIKGAREVEGSFAEMIICWDAKVLGEIRDARDRCTLKGDVSCSGSCCPYCSKHWRDNTQNLEESSVAPGKSPAPAESVEAHRQ